METRARKQDGIRMERGLGCREARSIHVGLVEWSR